MSAATHATDPADRIAGETLITFRDVAGLYPSARAKRLHLGTVRRWWRRGICGVRLGTVLIGGTRYTSREELARFRRAVAAARVQTAQRMKLPTPRVARREYERAKAANDRRADKGR